ncbi:MAG TPA: energy transducer TonB [Spirochaetota bacterium]|nr:energy transducer TonB [Spirochaetota bacterium]HPJ33325.1 energy transducer TonB [Spirochaetota bacterium]
MNRIQVFSAERIKIYFRHHPDLAWALLSFVFLFAMLFLVRWSESSVYDDFDVDETIEMIELRLSEPKQIAEIVESTELAESDIKEVVEDKPLSFGQESSDFNDLDNSSTPPRPLFSRTPPYPDTMRKAGVEGVVAVELGIDENGNVVYGKIVRSLGRDFDVAVIQWAKRIRFYPAKDCDRRPMKCRILLPVRFKLEG